MAFAMSCEAFACTIGVCCVFFAIARQVWHTSCPMTPPDPLCHRCGAPKSQHHALLSHPQQHVALVCPTALFLHESDDAAPAGFTRLPTVAPDGPDPAA